MKIGLALSGGGVLGVAHVGVLEEIDRNHVEIDMISGTSAGAIIGVLYADGGVHKIMQFIDDLDREGLFTKKGLLLNLTPQSIFKKIRLALQKNLSTDNFNELKIEFVCTATDIVEGEGKIFESGSLVDSVMASAAYPGVFPIQEVDQSFYIDGGITSNLPAAPLKEKGMDFVIGSSLYSIDKFEKFKQEGNKKSNRIRAAIRSLDIMQKALAEYEMMVYCDYCFTPSVSSYNWYNFDRINELTEIGRTHAKEQFPDLKKMIQSYRRKHFVKNIFDDVAA